MRKKLKKRIKKDEAVKKVLEEELSIKMIQFIASLSLRERIEFMVEPNPFIAQMMEEGRIDLGQSTERLLELMQGKKDLSDFSF